MVSEYSDQWSRMAQYWDARDDWGYEHLLVPTVLELAGDLEGRAVIDVGCGTGDLCRRMSALGAKVLGLDFSRRMLTVAKRHRDHLRAKPEYVLADTLHMAVQTTSQDVAVVNMTLQAIEDYSSVLAEIRRVLKNSGMLIMSVEHPFFALGRKDHVLTKRKWKSASDDETQLLSYFEEHTQIIEWPNNEKTTHYFRSLSSYSMALQKTGFRISSIREPIPQDQTSTPGQYSVFSLLPRFLVIKAEANHENDTTSLQYIQSQVRQWMTDAGTDKWPPLSILAQIMEELGEASRIVNVLYGNKQPKPSEHFDAEALGLELGGLLFALACLADSLYIDLGQSFYKTLNKYRERDKDRFKNKV